jgi:hypothetical protein
VCWGVVMDHMHVQMLHACTASNAKNVSISLMLPAAFLTLALAAQHNCAVRVSDSMRD